MNFKSIFLCAILHSIKISYIFIVLITAIWLLSADSMPYEGGYFMNLCIVGGVLCFLRLIFGGWSSSSLKGMGWQVVLSTVGALIAMIMGMNSGESGIHIWPIVIAIAVSAIIGGFCYNFMDDLLTNSTDMDAGDLIDSVFSNGLKNTFNDVMSVVEGNMYYSASRGVAAYSNTVLILSLLVAGYYM